MIGVVYEQVGAEPVVRCSDVPDPEPGPSSVLIRVEAAGVNFVDVLLRRGDYPQAPPPPFVPGSEVAGEVVDTGTDVVGLAPGDRVLALTDGTGGFAELATAPADHVYQLPPGANPVHAAAFMLTFLTAYLPLTRQLKLHADSVALVHAAGGGVGTAALQILRHLGVRSLATAGSDGKRALARELGASEAFDSRDEAIVDRVREATEGRGVDAIVDPVGGKLTLKSLSMLAPLGTLLMLGYAGGPWPRLDPARLVGRNLGVAGFYLGRLMRLDPPTVRRAGEEVLAIWSSGEVAPVVGVRLRLDEAERALELLEERAAMGKVVLAV